MFDFKAVPNNVYHDAVRRAFGGNMITRTGSEYNFRCPICGDSQKDKHKKRAYIYFGKQEWVYACFNGTCEIYEPKPLLYVFKHYYPEIYKTVLFSGLQNKSENEYEHIKEKNVIKSYKPTGPSVFKEGELISIFDNNELCKKALELCERRKIRKEVYSKWFVCLKDDKFLTRDASGAVQFNDKNRPMGNEYGYRLIIPYYKYGGVWSQFDARDLRDNSYLRYRNLEGVEKEFYNIDWLDTTKPFFLLEGSIDSSFIKNAVSFGGIKGMNQLFREHPEVLQNKQNGIFIWDNDDSGKDQLEHTVNMGFKWFNWKNIVPKEEFKLNSDGTFRTIKDINEAVMYSDCFTRDEKEYITLDSIMKYVELPDPIKAMVLNGNRKKIKNEKRIQNNDKNNLFFNTDRNNFLNNFLRK